MNYELDLRPLAIVFVMLLSGCADLPSGGEVDVHPPPEIFPLKIDVSGTSVLWNGVPSGQNFEVRQNATSIIMEVVWACEAGPCELRLLLGDPEGKLVADAVGSGEARVSTERPDEGHWNSQVRPAQFVARAQGEIRVTVFYGPVPEDYTAFE